MYLRLRGKIRFVYASGHQNVKSQEETKNREILNLWQTKTKEMHTIKAQGQEKEHPNIRIRVGFDIILVEQDYLLFTICVA